VTNTAGPCSFCEIRVGSRLSSGVWSVERGNLENVDLASEVLIVRFEDNAVQF